MKNLTIDWTKLTDAEKNATFAEYVAGWINVRPKPKAPLSKLIGKPPVVGSADTNRVPDYLHSVNAILSWLPKPGYGYWDIRLEHNGQIFVAIHIYGSENEPVIKTSGNCRLKSITESIMVALLRIKGVEVIT